MAPVRKIDQVVMLLAKSYKIDTRVKNEADSLTQAGYNVTVLTWDRFGYHSADTFVDGVRVISWRLLNGLKSSKAGYALAAILLQIYCITWCLPNMKRPYILHCNDFNTLPAGIFLKITRPSLVRLVYDCHELTPSAYAEWYSFRVGLLAGSLEKILLTKVDRILTVSSPIRNYLSSLTRKPITIVFNTISRKSVPLQNREWWRKKLGLDGFVVAYVGLLRQDAALDELIDAATHFKNSKRKDIRFLIVGDGPDLPKIKMKATGLVEYVKFVPRVPHAEALGYVRASDISFAVYRRGNRGKLDDARAKLMEGNVLVSSPWKVFEAMACGTCVMVRGSTYTWLFVNKLGYGISAGAGTSSEIIDALTWALGNPQRVEEMSNLARSHFLKEYNWEEMAEVLVSLYDSLAL